MMTTLRQIAGQRICLTFDDGPHPDYTPSVLDLLGSYGCRATFFLLGDSALRYPHLVQRISREGHSLGNHTFSHPRLQYRQGEQGTAQILRCQQVLEQLAGQRPRWFRPPYGRLTPGLAQAATQLGLTTVLWSRSAIDWGPLGTQRGIARRLRRATAGDILLLHDAPRRHNHPQYMLTALPNLLARLEHDGIAAIGLDEYAPLASV
ncbi:MAG: polysaccharide deacetylase family protein [Porticoccaceae bacterium]|nr:polysaccharide deacetylase family protein [Porticoccaceae bacterium]